MMLHNTNIGVIFITYFRYNMEIYNERSGNSILKLQFSYGPKAIMIFIISKRKNGLAEMFRKGVEVERQSIFIIIGKRKFLQFSVIISTKFFLC